MRRYFETIFRYWLLLALPLIVLPGATYMAIRHLPKNVTATANILVGQSVAGPTADMSQWQTPADAEVSNLTQLLQSPSFDMAVAHSSPLYNDALRTGKSTTDSVVLDFSSNIAIVAVGPSLVSISYASKYPDIALQVVNSMIGTARNQAQLLSKQQAQSGITYYTYQLQIARQNLRQSTDKLNSYMKQHRVRSSQLNAQMAVDPQLATLYRQTQSDLSAVDSAQQNIATYHTQYTLPSSIVSQGAFTVADQPRLKVVSNKKTQITYLAIALIVALVLSGGFVVLRTVRDRSIRYADEVEALLGLPVLAVIPYNVEQSVRRPVADATANRAPVRGRWLKRGA